MTAPKVLGVDLSLTGTGLAGDGWADTVVPPGPPKRNAAWRRLSPDEQRWALTEYRHVRLAFVLGAIHDRYLATQPDLVVLEGLSYDSFDTDRQLAGLAWQVRHSLWRTRIAYATVPPSCLKQFATGNGAASKAEVVRAARGRFGWFDGDDNAADATWLMAVGYAALGAPLYGLLSDVQARAVAKCAWPDLEPLRRSQRPPSADAWAMVGGL